VTARNSGTGFGWVSRALHWTMALGILAMIGLGLTLISIKPSLSILWLYALHKSTGLTLLTLALMRIGWHRISAPPPPLDDGKGARWQVSLAVAVHRTLYALLLAVPLTGWIASAATGIDIIWWNTITLPRIAPVSETWETGFFLAHKVLTRALMVVLGLHLSGVIFRTFVKRDRTLRRMIGGS